MSQRYSNGILTVIAIALVVLAWRALLEDASGQARGCGDSKINPCYVQIVTSSLLGNAIDVNVVNGSLEVNVANEPIEVTTMKPRYVPPPRPPVVPAPKR